MKKTNNLEHTCARVKACCVGRREHAADRRFRSGRRRRRHLCDSARQIKARRDACGRSIRCDTDRNRAPVVVTRCCARDLKMNSSDSPNVDNEKLAKLQRMAAGVRTGGKGSVRRKKKAVHKAAPTDDKRLQSTLKRLQLNQLPGIEEVNIIRENGTFIHFKNPKVQAHIAANTYVVSGNAETKPLTEMMNSVMDGIPGAGGMGGTKLEQVQAMMEQLQASGHLPAGMNLPSGTDPAALAAAAEKAVGAANAAGEGDDDDDDDVPDLVDSANFEDAAKTAADGDGAANGDANGHTDSAKEELTN